MHLCVNQHRLVFPLVMQQSTLPLGLYEWVLIKLRMPLALRPGKTKIGLSTRNAIVDSSSGSLRLGVGQAANACRIASWKDQEPSKYRFCWLSKLVANRSNSSSTALL